MLRHIEHVYLYRLASALRKEGVSRRAAFRRLCQEVGPISTISAIRCATNSAFEL